MTDLESTRLSLHAVAELLVAGPQKRESDTVRLRVVPGGFATVRQPDLGVVEGELTAGATSVDIDGRTVAELGAALGLTPFPLAHVYTDATRYDVDSALTVDPAACAVLAEAWRVGDEALAAFAPDAERVLWPEHFDVAVAADEVTYGVSPGDALIGVPYVYVSPFSKEGLDDPFWNQPFGAARPLAELGDATAVAAWLEQGRTLVRSTG